MKNVLLSFVIMGLFLQNCSTDVNSADTSLKPQLYGLWRSLTEGPTAVYGYRGFFEDHDSSFWVYCTQSTTIKEMYIQKGLFTIENASSSIDSVHFFTDSVATISYTDKAEIGLNMKKAVKKSSDIVFKKVASAVPPKVWQISIVNDTLIIQNSKQVRVE